MPIYPLLGCVTDRKLTASHKTDITEMSNDWCLFRQDRALWKMMLIVFVFIFYFAKMFVILYHCGTNRTLLYSFHFCFHVLLTGLWNFQFLLFFFFPSGIFRHYLGMLWERQPPCQSADTGFMLIHNRPFHQQIVLALRKFLLTANVVVSL